MKIAWVKLAVVPAALWCVFALGGCASPSKVNITLRKEVDSLKGELDHYKIQHEGDVTRIHALEAQKGTLATLPQERLDRLSTAHSLKLGRLTGGWDADGTKSGDEGIKVDVVPIDGDGDPIKAIGTFTIEAFDLASSGEKVGQWKFPPANARKNFYSNKFLYTFVLTCPWQRVPTHPQVTIKVTFLDELSQRTLNVQTVSTVTLPPATQPATRPATTATAR